MDVSLSSFLSNQLKKQIGNAWALARAGPAPGTAWCLHCGRWGSRARDGAGSALVTEVGVALPPAREAFPATVCNQTGPFGPGPGTTIFHVK